MLLLLLLQATTATIVPGPDLAHTNNCKGFASPALARLLLEKSAANLTKRAGLLGPLSACPKPSALSRERS